MDVIGQIKKLDMPTVAIWIFGFLATIGPGLLFIFIFNRELIVSLDVLKLMLLSGAITVPILFTNMLLIAFIIGEKGRDKISVTDSWFFATLWSIFCLYGPILISCFISLSAKELIIAISCFEAILFLLVSIIYKLTKDS